jgi:TolB protein
VVIEAELVNLLTGQTLASPKITVASGAVRVGAHRLSDVIFQKITGVRGAFDTRIAYVSVEGEAPNQRYQLIVADADGENAHPVTEASRPIMSPAWSPDGEWLAYVSFERRVSAIYLQRLRTGERTLVSARVGVNGAPAWSPDGKKLALTLSGNDGNLDIYVLDLATQALTRVTTDPAIDTEPTWADAQTLYFTSDRGGGPQLQRATAPLSRPHPARFRDPRWVRLSRRGPGSRHRRSANPLEGPPGSVPELRAERRHAHLCGTR